MPQDILALATLSPAWSASVVEVWRRWWKLTQSSPAAFAAAFKLQEHNVKDENADDPHDGRMGFCSTIGCEIASRPMECLTPLARTLIRGSA
jgi:hypothetical protein